MRQKAFESLGFVCPACRQRGDVGVLVLNSVSNELDGFILEGLIACTNEICQSQFPIISGVPVIIRDMEAWWQGNRQNLAQPAFGAEVSRYLMELDARSETYRQSRSLLSTYLRAHYGEDPQANAYWSTLTNLVGGDAAHLPSLDLGCSVGRFTVELSRLTTLAVGVDSDIRVAQAAAEIQRSGELAYQQPQSARRFVSKWARSEVRDNVLFVVADAEDPPFRAAAFGAVAALNLLDNVGVPLTLLGQMDALLAPGGSLIVSSPYQWQSAIAESGQWLEAADCPPGRFVRGVLCEQLVPQMPLNYEIEHQIEALDWKLVIDDRQSRHFKSDVIVARKD